MDGRVRAYEDLPRLITRERYHGEGGENEALVSLALANQGSYTIRAANKDDPGASTVDIMPRRNESSSSECVLVSYACRN